MDFKRVLAKGLRAILQPPAITNSVMAKEAKVCSGSQVNNSKVDKYSYIGHDCFLLNAEIGPFCSIADNCRIGGDAHPIRRVSTSPVFHEGKNVMRKNFAQHSLLATPAIKIGADVWIGAGATVMSGVCIDTGSVIGAGSIVTKDVGPYEIWVGNPARKLRDRFEPTVKEGLLHSQWWTWTDAQLTINAAFFDDPKKFLEKLDLLESI